MKIGILTFHSALNYGAVLQSYASVCLLRSLGHEPYVIDYENPAIKQYSNPLAWDKERFRQDGIKYILKRPVLDVKRLRRACAFRRFRSQYLPMLPYSRAAEMDLLLVGSDQVWNKELTGGPDQVYFGNILPSVRKVAWAASAGKATLSAEDIRSIRQNFASVSVREQSLADLIPGSVLLPDPTMMLTADQWQRLVKPVEGSYVLAYAILHQDEVMENARAEAERNRMPLLVVSPGIKLGSSWIQTASPDEFVSLFRHAAHVVTSSFHGAVFTTLFDRPHTFVHHLDPRFSTLLQTDLQSARAAAASFLEDILQPCQR
ncbi:MAG: polysaccharide pyruvyl transferase family protein [Bacteroidales bacterium]|nr:polysaccharide pyruvyl transferase family protein [Bacteroidales bacterium]